MADPQRTLDDAVSTGSEWLVDAYGCSPDALRSVPIFAQLFARIIGDLGLRPVAHAVWHCFPGAGGLTGVLLLSESHLACHTFPERGFAAINLYCCRPRPEWRWTEELRARIDASRVVVRTARRGAAADALTPAGVDGEGEGAAS